MIDFTSAKSTLMRPGVVIRSVIPPTPCSSTSSAILKASIIDTPGVGQFQQALVGDDDEGVDLVPQRLDPLLGLDRAAPPLEAERPGDDGHGQGPDPPGDAGDDGGAAGAGAATLAGGDEDHVGAAQGILDLVLMGQGGLAAHIGVGAGAEAPGEVPADVEFEVGIRHQQRLGVGVDGDELDAAQASLDHPVDGVDATTAHADDLDHGQVGLRAERFGCHGRTSPADANPIRRRAHPGARRQRPGPRPEV